MLQVLSPPEFVGTPGQDPHEGPIGWENLHHRMNQKEDHCDKKHRGSGKYRPPLTQEGHQSEQRDHCQTGHALKGRLLVNRETRHEEKDGAGAGGQGDSLQ